LDMTLEDCVLLMRNEVSKQMQPDHVKNFIEETSKSYHDENKSDFYRTIIENVITTFSLTNWCKYNYLSTDFGCGKASRMLYLDKFDALHHGTLFQNTDTTHQLVCGITDSQLQYLRQNFGNTIVKSVTY